MFELEPTVLCPTGVTTQDPLRQQSLVVPDKAECKVLSFAQLVLTQLPEGALLQDELLGLPLISQHSWPRARADSFMLQN